MVREEDASGQNMTKNDSAGKNRERLNDRQVKAIPHLVASPTFEEGRKRAKVSRDTLYRWLRCPSFREELKRQRDVVTEEALEILKQNVMMAVTTLIHLLHATKSDSLKRHLAKDILDYFMRAKELQEVEERLTQLETIVSEGVKQEEALGSRRRKH
jgi:hypothetical protein